MTQNKNNQHSTKQSNASKSASSTSANRGFASMDPEKQREIASKGGKNSHKNDNR